MKSHPHPRKQKGVVLFIALVALLVLMIAAVALIRSTDTAQVVAGNLAIKRDMTHESEQAVSYALASFRFPGPFAAEDARLNSNFGSPAAIYSAKALPSNVAGIPLLLTQAGTTGETAAYASGMTYRYVIDRMCPEEGPAEKGNNNCLTGCDSGNGGGGQSSGFINDVDVSANSGEGLGVRTSSVCYRVSVRVTDARGTQSFFQTTFGSLGLP